MNLVQTPFNACLVQGRPILEYSLVHMKGFSNRIHLPMIKHHGLEVLLEKIVALSRMFSELKIMMVKKF